jgi:hypothetical protein
MRPALNILTSLLALGLCLWLLLTQQLRIDVVVNPVPAHGGALADR